MSGKQRRASALSMVKPGKRGSFLARQAAPRFMPTYRLESKNPFNPEIARNVMKLTMLQVLEDFSYSSKRAQALCRNISEEIKTRIKLNNFDRYKYVCIVTIGEKYMQGFNLRTNFLWDPEKDGFVSYVHDTPNFFAVATLYYLYYD